MAGPLAQLGLLALKAKQHAQFPSVRKMSEDWHQIALISADSYNTIVSLSDQLQQAQEERDRANTVTMDVMGERDGARRWAAATNARFLRAHDDAAKFLAERDAAIEQAEDAEAWMDMVKNASDFPKELLEWAEAADDDVAKLTVELSLRNARGKRAMHECSSYFNGWRMMKARAEAAEAKLLQSGSVVFTGLSVPKSELDEAKAEHARRCDELLEKIEAAEEAFLQAKQQWRRDVRKLEPATAEQRALLDRLFEYVMVQDGGFKSAYVPLANEIAESLGTPAEAQAQEEEPCQG